MKGLSSHRLYEVILRNVCTQLIWEKIARELIYWPGMAKEIEQIADSCDTCQNLTKRQQREPLIPHNRGETPFQKIGVDLFSIQERNYMYVVTVDYHSNFWEVDYLPSTITSTISTKLKSHIAPDIAHSTCSDK